MFEPIESGIAINAAVRADRDCTEKILLHGAAPMRPKYLETTAIWAGPTGVGLHFYAPYYANRGYTYGYDQLITIRITAKLFATRPKSLCRI